MGLFYVGCKVVNPAESSRSATVPRLRVDTGAKATWIDSVVLDHAGIEPRKKDVQFQMANGQIISRSIGYAILKVDKTETIDEVVFAQRGDLQLLGARALEGLNLKGDARAKKLVAAGPVTVAVAVPPRFGKLIRVPKHTTTPRRKKTKINPRRQSILKSKPIQNG